MQSCSGDVLLQATRTELFRFFDSSLSWSPRWKEDLPKFETSSDMIRVFRHILIHYASFRTSTLLEDISQRLFSLSETLVNFFTHRHPSWSAESCPLSYPCGFTLFSGPCLAEKNEETKCSEIVAYTISRNNVLQNSSCTTDVPYDMCVWAYRIFFVSSQSYTRISLHQDHYDGWLSEMQHYCLSNYLRRLHKRLDYCYIIRRRCHARSWCRRSESTCTFPDITWLIYSSRTSRSSGSQSSTDSLRF